MGLNVKKPPEGGLDIVRKALGKLSGDTSMKTAMLTNEAGTTLNIAAPHPVYFVGLTDVADGNLLSVAILTGWRYIVLSGDETIGAANISVNRDDKKLQFSHISHGPFARSTVEGIGYAESLPEVMSNDYELRLLDIPSLYVVSIWLHGNQDRLIPLPPTNRALKPYRNYSEAEMLDALRGPAIERLESEESSPT